MKNDDLFATLTAMTLRANVVPIPIQETEFYDHLRPVLKLKRDYDDAVGDDIGDIMERTFDRSETLNFTPADSCTRGISACIPAKLSFVKRIEKPLQGDDGYQIRLLSVFGTLVDVRLAVWLYRTVDVSIADEVHRFVNTQVYKRNPSPIDALFKYKENLSLRISDALMTLSGFAASPTRSTRLEAVEAHVMGLKFKTVPPTPQPAPVERKRERVRL